MKKTDPQRKNILFLPRWYPDQSDPQNAVFIRKHALAAAKVANISVIYVAPSHKERGLTVKKSGSSPDQLLEISWHYPPSALPVLGKLVNILRYLLGFLKCWKHLKKTGQRPVLIHAHMMTRQLVLARIFNIFQGIPYLVTEHWTGYRSGKFSAFPSWRKRLIKSLCKKARCITVVSPALEEAMKKEGITGNYRLLGNVVDPPPANVDSFFKGSPKVIRLGSVADFYDKKKNVTGLLRSLAPFLRRRPDVQFHLIGDGPDRPIVDDCLQQLALPEEQVKRYGRLPNESVLQFMKGIDLYICFSNVETFSVATAEALLAGKPVVCTASGGPEYFVDDRCGRVIPLRDGEALIEAIESLLGPDSSFDPVYAYRHIQEKYGIEAVSLEIKRLYDSILTVKQAADD
jgi:glycosyltransferase involved in cell wall biosynthesis